MQAHFCPHQLYETFSYHKLTGVNDTSLAVWDKNDIQIVAHELWGINLYGSKNKQTLQMSDVIFKLIHIQS